MTFMLVSEDARTLEDAAALINELQPGAEVLSFTESPAALAEARERPVDVALLAANMPELDGLDLGQYLKELHPAVNLVFMDPDDTQALDALSLHASGCLLLPVSKFALSAELDDLRYPVSGGPGHRVFAQTFGNFELFVDGEPVAFKYSRTKEVVALLVNNRGAQTTNGEIIAALWEDDGDPEKKASYLRNLRQDLQNTFTRLKLTDLLRKQRGSMAIAADRIDCDLYDWIAKKDKSRYRYMGDYMNQYSWAETVHAELDAMNDAL
ncbi:MAG: response regulator [Clostridia bacterium]|nr:response regulator [Clostridia bacterium]MBQ8964532.1 response regulator [Clostridia bacterium]MBQ9038667.1 response regulator [Clostridia bacterium]